MKPSPSSPDPALSVEIPPDIARAFALRCQHLAVSIRQALVLIAMAGDPDITFDRLRVFTGSASGGTLSTSMRSLRQRHYYTPSRRPEPEADQRHIRYRLSPRGRDLVDFILTGREGETIPPFRPEPLP